MIWRAWLAVGSGKVAVGSCLLIDWISYRWKRNRWVDKINGKGKIKKVCQIMKLTVDIVIFGCYISWAVGNNCFFKWDNLIWFLKEKRNLKKWLTTWNKRVKVIKSLEQSRQSYIWETFRKSGRVRKASKKTWKKFLTKQNRCDKVNKLSQDRRPW